MIGGADPILNAVEIASDLRCSRAHVYHLMKGTVRGVPPLPVIPIGRRLVVRRSTLEQWKNDAEKILIGATLEPSPNIDAVGASRRNR